MTEEIITNNSIFIHVKLGLDEPHGLVSGWAARKAQTSQIKIHKHNIQTTNVEIINPKELICAIRQHRGAN